MNVFAFNCGWTEFTVKGRKAEFGLFWKGLDGSVVGCCAALLSLETCVQIFPLAVYATPAIYLFQVNKPQKGGHILDFISKAVRQSYLSKILVRL